MLISGIKKTTLLDYPGKIATIIFTLGCNFRCHYCHNYEFVLPENVKEFMNDLIPEETFFNFLKSRVGFLDGVVITGGEPTIQKDLKKFIRKIKDLGFLVKLDTNGRNPKLLKELMNEKLIDYVAMDIKNPFDKYRAITGVDELITPYIQSMQILLDGDIDYEFRTTVAKGYHTPLIIEEIGEQIKGAKKWYLQNFEEKNILNAGFDGRAFTPVELEDLRRIGYKYADICEVRK